MKIGVTCYPTAGGSGVIATELGIEMARRGHEVHFISYALPIRLPDFHENVFYHSVEVSAYPLFKFPPYDIALASRMGEVIESVGLDILHVHYAIPHAIAAYLANHMVKDSHTKILTTLHGTDITLVGAEQSYYSITKFAIEKSDGVTAVSEYLKDETYKLFDLDKDITVIPNFVNVDDFSPAAAKKIRPCFAAPDEKVLTHISNMRPVKRVHDVVEVFRRVQEEVPSRLLMIGEGPERRKAERLVKELGLTDKVSFLGDQEGIAEILAQSDLLLLPSEYETFGLVALEAMACGTPALVTKQGGTNELIRHGIDGFLCEVGDTEAMANHAITLLQSPASMTQFSQQARERATKHFSLTAIVDQYEALYRSL